MAELPLLMALRGKTAICLDRVIIQSAMSISSSQFIAHACLYLSTIGATYYGTLITGLCCFLLYSICTWFKTDQLKWFIILSAPSRTGQISSLIHSGTFHFTLNLSFLLIPSHRRPSLSPPHPFLSPSMRGEASTAGAPQSHQKPRERRHSPARCICAVAQRRFPTSARSNSPTNFY